MSKNFDWHSDENLDWDKLAEESSEKPPNNRRRRLLTLLLILVVLGGVTYYLVRTIERRADDNTSAMRSDVASSHNLMQVAEARQDDELFFSLLSGRDSTWTATKHELFQTDSLHDRTAFGLHALPVNPLPLEEDESYSVTFSPDFLTADMATYRPYEIQIGNGLTKTVTLQETAQYRLGQERWLLSPPDGEFWGAPQSAEGTRIRLTYPQRDETVSRRLLADLDRKVEELCTTLVDITCPPDLQFDIDFSTDPAALIDAKRPHAATTGAQGLKIVMPAPTLVGLPQDEEAYQALYRGYAAQLATATIAQQVGYVCCEQLPFFQALIDNQLSQLALKPWPVMADDYENILADQVRLQDFNPLWSSDDPQDLYGSDGRRVYALIDYLLDIVPESNPAMLQRELVRRGGFLGWLNGLLASESERTNTALLSMLTRGLWMRGYEQALDTGDGSRPNIPKQDILLTCVVNNSDSEDEQIATIYRFNMEDGNWNPIYDTSGFLWNSPLPGDDILLQQEFGIDDRRWTATIRQKEQLTRLLPNSENYTISFAQTDPATTGVAAFVFPPESNEATVTWFDLQACDEANGCANRELPGIPIWSPDGERALFTNDPNSQIDLLQTELRTVLFDRRAYNDILPLFVGSRSEFLEGDPLSTVESLTAAGRGHAPFWLDNNTFGYVTNYGELMTESNSVVMISDLDGNEPQVLLTLSELMAAIGEDFDSERLFWIHYAMINANNPDQLFVVVFSAVRQRAHVLSFDRPTGEIRHLMSAGHLANHSLGISPDGRYLVLTGVDEVDPNGGGESALLQVYDLEKQEVLPFLSLTADFPPFSTYDWSLSGGWLAMLLDDNTIGFLAPEQRHLELVETPPGECGSPAWINQNDG